MLWRMPADARTREDRQDGHPRRYVASWRTLSTRPAMDTRLRASACSAVIAESAALYGAKELSCAAFGALQGS
jgi:hypothetical protein